MSGADRAASAVDVWELAAALMSPSRWWDFLRSYPSRRWLLLALLPLAALGAVARASALRTDEHHESQERAQFLQLRGAFTYQHDAVALVVSYPNAYPAEARSLSNLNGQLWRIAWRLKRLATGDAMSDRLQRGLPRSYSAYQEPIDQMLALIAHHAISRARMIYRDRVLTDYVRLDSQITIATAQQNLSATRAASAAFVGDLVGYGSASLLILLSLWRFSAVSRRQERRRAENEVKTANDRYRQVVETANEGIFTLDADHQVTFVNPAIAEMLGFEAAEMVGRSVFEFIDETWVEDARRNLALTQEGLAGHMELALRGLGGRKIWTHLASRPVFDPHGGYLGALAMLSDVTERKQLEVQLLHLVERDPLTGIYNRRRFVAELDRELAFAARTVRAGAVLTLDLDNFKIANDRYGHATGDVMLRAVADVLTGRLRKNDTVARIGGDGFAVLLPEAEEQEAMAVARDIRTLLCERQIGPPIMCSIGIAAFGGKQELTADEVLVCADIALYEAKQHGGDQARVFTGQIKGALLWVQRIQDALLMDRFVLYAQPIVDLRTGLVSQEELLIRMLSDQDDVIPPGAFLPTAERFGLIQEIDLWVTRAGLRLAAEGSRTAINLSGNSIGQQSIVDTVREAIADGLDPSRVVFEITETAAMTNLAAAKLFAGTLNGLGCSLSLDDFGTGFGSFTYLKHLPARYVKIDMEFVKDLTVSKTDQQIVKSITQVAHSLNKQTIAEGVEAADTLELLRELKVDYAQGFHLGRPSPAWPLSLGEATVPVRAGAIALSRSAADGQPARPKVQAA